MISRHTNGWITVTAEGGNRMSRARRIADAVKGEGILCLKGVRYSETYGFQTQTEKVYAPAPEIF